VTAAAVIGLLMSGCGSEDEGKGSNSKSDGKGGFEVPDPGDKRPDLDDEPGGDGPPGDTGDGSVDPSELTGSWTTHPMVEGDSVAFDITSDKKVSMILPGHCKGTLSGKTMDLSCTEGKKGYTHGVIENATKKTMTVSWSNGRKVKMQRSKSSMPDAPDPEDPSDFPSAKDPF
jgi:hypothetical protein